MVNGAARLLRPDDLDEGIIYLYRLWAFALLKQHPRAVVLHNREYIMLSDSLALYCSPDPVETPQAEAVRSDSGLPVLCVAPRIPKEAAGLDLESGVFRGSDDDRKVVDALARSCHELPPAAKKRDPETGRWMRTCTGTAEIWMGKHCRLIADPSGEESFGYTWDGETEGLYFFRSKSCRREGQKVWKGSFKLSRQKTSGRREVVSLDLVNDTGDQAALLRLVPAGAGYKVFLRQIPASFAAIPAIAA